MKYIKKTLAMVFSVILMISLAGCGSTESDRRETASRSQTQEQGTAKDNEQAAVTVSDDTKSTQGGGEAADTSGLTGPVATSGGSDSLVVYFSRTGEQYTVGVINKGNTAIVAEMIADVTGQSCLRYYLRMIIIR